MKFIPLYHPAPARRARFLQPWARFAIGVLVCIPALYFGIKLFFGAMPVAESLLRAHGLLP